jgi:hypothetical protein
MESGILSGVSQPILFKSRNPNDGFSKKDCKDTQNVEKNNRRIEKSADACWHTS